MFYIKIIHIISNPRRNNQFVTFTNDNSFNLFNYVSKIGQKPIVIDSFDIRKDPRSALECLCLEVGLEFMSEMLSWPKGGHKSDGVWASHWYGSVHLSEGFSGEEANLPILNLEQNEISRNALPFYSALEEYKLKF